MMGSSERPSIAPTAIPEPDSAPSTVDNEIDSTYWRPRTRPTSLSIESSSTSIQPDRNRISPSRINSGTVPSAAVVEVSYMLFAIMPNAASPRVTSTPDTMMIRKARKIGAPVMKITSRSAIPADNVTHHSISLPSACVCCPA